MDNKITIMLGDKDAILQLAQDPEVQVKIKDSIAAAVAKMAGKGINEALPVVVRQVANEIDAEVLVKTNGYNYVLSDKYKKLVYEAARDAINDVIDEAVANAMQKYLDEVNEKVNFYKNILDERLERVDVDSIVKERVDKFLKDKVFVSKK